MKKQLLTAAVAAAVALPMIAQAGVYGRNDVTVGSFDRDSTGDYWDVGADKMRWGIVGSEDLGNGMKALYQYEFAMNSDNQGNGSTGIDEATRLAYVGLEGGWGKITGGRQWNPSYGAVWNKTDTADSHGTWKSNVNDDTFAGNNLSGNRTGNSVAYFTPNMSGFSAAVILVMDNQDTNAQAEDGIDKWDISAEYKNGPLHLGVTFANEQFDDAACVNCSDVDIWGVGATYKFGDFTVEGNFGNADPGSNGAETDVWGIGATYAMGDTQLSGAYRSNEVDNGGVETTDWYIGVRHFMSKETRVFAEYRNTEIDNLPAGDDEVDSFVFGMRKDWKL